MNSNNLLGSNASNSKTTGSQMSSSNAKPIQRFPAGEVLLPASKSLSHRAVICAALALAETGEQSQLNNLGRSQDIEATVACMSKIIGLSQQGGSSNSAILTGREMCHPAIPATPRSLRRVAADHETPVSQQQVLQHHVISTEREEQPEISSLCNGEAPQLTQSAAFQDGGEVNGADNNTLDCGESGSTLRFLIPLAAVDGRAWQFTGHGRLMQRPIDVYAKVFAESAVRFVQKNNSVLVQGPLMPGEFEVPGDISSQFISGLLLALPLTDGDSKLTLASPLESAAYVDLTINVMRKFGVAVFEDDDGNYTIPGCQQYQPASYTVEGDYSQAAYFLGAGALGRPVSCTGLAQQSLQGDAAILNILSQMGAKIIWENGAVRAEGRQRSTEQSEPEFRLLAVTIDAREIPDLVPPLAVLCSLAEGTSKIINAGRLRLKESDRLAAMAQELQKLGAIVQESADSLTITGQPSLCGGVVDAHGDHRIAMSMALAAIGCGGSVHLSGWENVQKSYPAFWTDFEKEACNG